MKVARIVLGQGPFEDLVAKLQRRGGEKSTRGIAHGKDVIARTRIAGCKLGGEIELRQPCVIARDSSRQVLGPQTQLPILQGTRSVIGLVDQDSRRYRSRECVQHREANCEPHLQGLESHVSVSAF